MPVIPICYVVCNYFVFLSGGIVLVFSGKNLDSVQSPLMEITDFRFNHTPPVVRFFWIICDHFVFHSLLMTSGIFLS